MKALHNLYGKKLLPLPILLLLILSLLSALNVNIPNVSALDSPAIYIEPATTENPSYTVGTYYNISIKTDYSQFPPFGITAYQFSLSYDPDVLHGGIQKTDWDFIGTGDDVTKTFNTTQTPVVPDTEEVYVNQTLMTKYAEKTDTWTGDGVTQTFFTSQTPVVDYREAGSEYQELVYVNSSSLRRYDEYTIDYAIGRIWIETAPEDGVEVKVEYFYGHYAINYKEGEITFTTAPETGAEVKAKYFYDGVVNGDVIVGLSAQFVPGTFNNTEGTLSLTAGFYSTAGDFSMLPGTLANVTFLVVSKGNTTITLGTDTKLYGWDIFFEVVVLLIDAETMPNNIGHGTFDNRFLHDVAVVSVTAPDKAAVGEPVDISVEVANLGKSDETVEVAVSYDGVPIETKPVPLLLVGKSETVPFIWDTTGVGWGNYTINVTATIEGDGDPTDNWNTATIFLVAHDVAVVSVTAPDKAAVGEPVDISVEVANEGAFDEVANVTIHYGPTYIDSQNVPLAKGENKTVSFIWDTTGVGWGNYTINATARLTNTTDTWTALGISNMDAWIGNGTQTSFITTQTPVVPDSEEVYVNQTLMTRITNITDAWIGNGTQTSFITTQTPVVPDSEEVYVNQTLMTKPANYTIDYDTGNITFTTAPEEGVEIKVKYRYVDYTIDYDTGEISFTTAPGLGVNVTATYLYLGKTFVTTQTPVVPDSEEVYVNQTLMTKPANYTIDYDTGNITFTTAPGLGVEIKAIYLPVDTNPTDNWNTTTILIVEHDVAIISLDAPTEADFRDQVPINVTVKNIGSHEENVTLTVYYTWEKSEGSRPLGEENSSVILAAGKNKTVPFSWNTTDLVARGKYEIGETKYKINVTATIPPGDDDPTDNTIKPTIIKLKSHDLKIISFQPSPYKVFVGELVEIEVKVNNVGMYNETFTVKVTCMNDTNIIGENQSISLSLGSLISLQFIWNTTNVAPDSYKIKAEAILAEGKDIKPRDNTKYYSYVFVNPPLGTIDGTVTDASNDLPIPGANITAGDYSATTDAEGYYNITDVPAGTYTVTVSATGYEDSSQTNIIVVAGETTTLNFTLTPLPTVGTITGIVKDSSGDPIVDAIVTVNNMSATTNSSGAYVISNVPAGTYTVTVSATGYKDSSQTNIIVVAGETTTVDFELTRVQPLDILLYAGGAVVAIIIIAGIAVYILKVRKPT